jgi:asparagine synthase (glutamine-hydrolysing)
MTLRYLPGSATFFSEISKLNAAHVMECSAGKQTISRLWAPAYEPKATASEATLLDEFDALMKMVVGEHLMSEVPLGAFLSGGIDSSLVTAYAAQATREPIRTFSIGVNQDAQSELPWARMVADRYATRHFETVVQPDLAALAPRMVSSMEEPVDPFACGVYVVSEVAARHVTVALGGDGGDELFAGYDRYKGQQLAEYYSHIPSLIRHKLLRPLIRHIPDSFGYNSFTNKLRWLDQLADSSGVERYADSAAFLRFPHRRKLALISEQVWKEIGRNASEKLLEDYQRRLRHGLLDRMLHTDFMTRLPTISCPSRTRCHGAQPGASQPISRSPHRGVRHAHPRRTETQVGPNQIFHPQARRALPAQGATVPAEAGLRRPVGAVAARRAAPAHRARGSGEPAGASRHFPR